MDVEVTSDVFNVMIREAGAAHPREACGILLGAQVKGIARIAAVIPASNVHPSPQTHFEIDPQVLIDAHRAVRGDGRQVLGYYHSHPRGNCDPSDTDRAQSAGDNRIWAIIAGQEVRLWRDTAEGFVPLHFAVLKSLS